MSQYKSHLQMYTGVHAPTQNRARTEQDQQKNRATTWQEQSKNRARTEQEKSKNRIRKNKKNILGKEVAHWVYCFFLGILCSIKLERSAMHFLMNLLKVPFSPQPPVLPAQCGQRQ